MKPLGIHDTRTTTERVRDAFRRPDVNALTGPHYREDPDRIFRYGVESALMAIAEGVDAMARRTAS